MASIGKVCTLTYTGRIPITVGYPSPWMSFQPNITSSYDSQAMSDNVLFINLMQLSIMLNFEHLYFTNSVSCSGPISKISAQNETYMVLSSIKLVNNTFSDVLWLSYMTMLCLVENSSAVMGTQR